jgi:hypothetical protein
MGGVQYRCRRRQSPTSRRNILSPLKPFVKSLVFAERSLFFCKLDDFFFDPQPLALAHVVEKVSSGVGCVSLLPPQRQLFRGARHPEWVVVNGCPVREDELRTRVPT